MLPLHQKWRGHKKCKITFFHIFFYLKPLKRREQHLLFWRGMPTLKPVIFTKHKMQPFRASAPIQEETYFHTYCSSSLESQVLDFTPANNEQVYQISSRQKLQHPLCQFYHNFLKKTTIIPKSFPERKKVGT